MDAKAKMLDGQQQGIEGLTWGGDNSRYYGNVDQIWG
jgi:hypothetical protein